MHMAVEACIVTGANLGQPLGILMLSADAAKRSTDADQRREFESSFETHLSEVNAKLDPHEQLDCLIIVTSPWTV